MTWARQERDRCELIQAVGRADCETLLRRLQLKQPHLSEFSTWVDVLVFIDHVDVRSIAADPVLRAIFRERDDGTELPWQTVLLLLFWRSLESIHVFKRRWDWDADELWANIHWHFLRTAHRIELASRSDRLGQKIVNDTTHRVYVQYRNQWVRAKRELTEPHELERLADARAFDDFVEVDERLDMERELESLERLTARGSLEEVDLALVVGADIYGMPLREISRERGISYEAAKKRRQRALIKLSCRREMSAFRRILSPKHPRRAPKRSGTARRRENDRA